MARLSKSIEMEDGKNPIIETFDGKEYISYEFVSVYYGRGENDIDYDASKKLGEKEITRLTSLGMDVKSEFLGGVMAIYKRKE